MAEIQREATGVLPHSASAEPSLPMVPRDRWLPFLKWTIAINVGCLLLHSLMTCGCHFHPEALIVALVAFLWGFYPFFFYRTGGERIVGYLALGLSMLWPIPEFEYNTQFLIRSIVYHLTVSAQ
jgi:hypothetical protein